MISNKKKFNCLTEHPLYRLKQQAIDMIDLNTKTSPQLNSPLPPPTNNNSSNKLKSSSVTNLRSFDQQSTTSDFYLQPVIDNSTPLPFPLPKNGDIVKSRTDENLTLLSKNLPKNIYININETAIYDTLIDANRFDLLDELIIRERNYIELLKIIYEDYFLVLTKSELKLLSHNQMNTIFFNLKDIYNFHYFELLPDLDLKYSSIFTHNLRVQTPTICDLFAKHLDKIRYFDFYVNNLKESITYLDKLSETSSVFKSHLDQIDKIVVKKFAFNLSSLKDEYNIQPNLKSLLIHVLIWPDFMNKFFISYENFITFDHPDFKYYDESIRYFTELATKSFETIEDLKQLDVLKRIQKRLGNKYNILDRKRNLLKEGPLVTISPHLGSIIHVYIILLNDMLIICDQANNEHDQLKPKRPLDAIGMTVSPDVNAFSTEGTSVKLNTRIRFASTGRSNYIDPDNGFAINVPCVQKVFRFYARNSQEKTKWFNVFRTVTQANKFEMQIDRSFVGRKKPKFIPDTLCHYCFKCKGEFTTMNRKHHCKGCGYLFCSSCSRMQAVLEYEPNKRSRICDYCYDQLFGTFRSGPPSIEDINQRFRRNFSQFNNEHKKQYSQEI